jgi:hypothetical protein
MVFGVSPIGRGPDLTRETSGRRSLVPVHPPSSCRGRVWHGDCRLSTLRRVAGGWSFASTTPRASCGLLSASPRQEASGSTPGRIRSPDPDGYRGPGARSRRRTACQNSRRLLSANGYLGARPEVPAEPDGSIRGCGSAHQSADILTARATSSRGMARRPNCRSASIAGATLEFGAVVPTTGFLSLRVNIARESEIRTPRRPRL